MPYLHAQKGEEGEAMTHDKALKVARGFFGHGIATDCHLAAPCYKCDALASLIEAQRAEAVEEARAGIERAARIEALTEACSAAECSERGDTIRLMLGQLVKTARLKEASNG